MDKQLIDKWWLMKYFVDKAYQWKLSTYNWVTFENFIQDFKGLNIDKTSYLHHKNNH